MFVKTIELAAVAAVHSVDPDRWWTEYSAMIDRIAPRFARYEPLRHAGELILGMVSGLDRKNCWTIAEHRGASARTGCSTCWHGPVGTPTPCGTVGHRGRNANAGRPRAARCRS